MRSRQQGMTVIGLVFVAVFVGIFAFAVLKVVPAYLEQMKVGSILEDVKRELDGSGSSISQIRNAIGKRLNIEMVTGIKAQDFSIKKSSAGGYVVQAKYERREPYLGNVYLVVAFDKQVEIKR